ncbi:MAG TPA: ATP-binding protein, partial [Anaerolineae bacterium]|nr:ATP-binding protein [Anaerolineae bacterium]
SLYEVSQELSASSHLSELLGFIIQKATLLVGAERGFVVLVRPDDSYYIAAARHYAPSELAAEENAFSSSLMTRVIREDQSVLTTNIQEDERYELTQSIITQQIRSVLAVPLVARGETVGAIYVDTRMSERLFAEPDLKLLQAMASQAAMAIRNARLYQETQASNERLTLALQELRQTQEQLVQAERLAAVGRLAASVAHELRNPLMVMRSQLFFLNRLAGAGNAVPSEIVRRHIGKLDGEIDRQGKIINDLLFFSRNRPRTLTDVDLNALLQETILRVPRAESIAVETDLDPSLGTIRADCDQVQQVFVNLVSNAIQAMKEGGVLLITSRRDGFFGNVEVRDTGVGISAGNLTRLFEPFFTTKDNGIGLGLAVTKSIVEGHRGKISVESREGCGTMFTVSLPLELCG